MAMPALSVLVIYKHALLPYATPQMSRDALGLGPTALCSAAARLIHQTALQIPSQRTLALTCSQNTLNSLA